MTSLRSTAERWAWRTAFVSLVLFVVAFALGDRRMAARRYGWWATVTGSTWWLGPLLLTAVARRWLPSFDATTSAVVDAFVRPIRAWSIGLALSGSIALVAVSILILCGALAGLIPAKRAITLKPVDAIRIEI